MGRKAGGARALRWTYKQGYDIVAVVTDSHFPHSPTARVARELGLRLWSIDEAQEAASRDKPRLDLVVSFLYWRIIKQPLLSAPKLGVINFHPAPLPDYKGVGGYNLAILEGRSDWGVSAHYVDAGIDTGDIIEVRDFSIDPKSETAWSLERASSEELLALYKATLLRVGERNSLLSTTPNVGGRYLDRRSLEELKLINTGDDIDRKIRAFWFPPYSGAQVEIAGTRYTLISDAVLSELAAHLDPDGTHLKH